jgi:hypothetical protein
VTPQSRRARPPASDRARDGDLDNRAATTEPPRGTRRKRHRAAATEPPQPSRHSRAAATGPPRGTRRKRHRGRHNRAATAEAGHSMPAPNRARGGDWEISIPCTARARRATLANYRIAPCIFG